MALYPKYPYIWSYFGKKLLVRTGRLVSLYTDCHCIQMSLFPCWLAFKTLIRNTGGGVGGLSYKY